MEIFSEMSHLGHENLLFLQHKESGLKAVLAIHDSSLGPAVGGIRFWKYQFDSDAILDALELAETASLTAALLDCDLGGGQVIVLASPEEKNEVMLRALGAYIHGLGGRFIATAEIGTTNDDLLILRKETTHVVGGGFSSGAVELGKYSAKGVFLGMRAAAKTAFGSDNLKGRSIGILGMESIGLSLTKLLFSAGARVFVSDFSFERVKLAKDRFPEVEMVPPANLLEMPLDVLSPCGVGDILIPENVGKFKCKVIAGSSGNHFGAEKIIEKLHAAGIWCVPDFMLNAGDMIMVDSSLRHHPPESILSRIENMYGMVERLFAQVRERKQNPVKVAKEWAWDRMKKTRSLKKIFRPPSVGRAQMGGPV